MRKAEGLAGAQVGVDGRIVHGGLGRVLQQNMNDISLFDGFLYVVHGKAVGLGVLPAIVHGSVANAHNHVDAAVAQVFALCLALAAVTDDGNGLSVQHGNINVFVPVNFTKL